MRKTIQKLALMAIALLSSVAASAEDFTISDLKYTVIDGTSNVKVESGNVRKMSGDVVIPATVENNGTMYTVTEIAVNGFYDETGVTSFTFAEGSALTTVGRQAFYNTGITTVPNLPNTIISFGTYVFASCKQLTNATLPDFITEIPEGTFASCWNMETITIGSNVTKIGSNAFQDCDKVTSITIPTGVTEIGSSVFWSIGDLTTVTFAPRTAEQTLKLGNNVFYSCEKLESISLPDQTIEMGYGVFNGCTSLASAHFPTGTTTVPDNTFWSCKALTSITGLDNITKIGTNAFRNTGLTSFTMPNTVTSLGTSVFEDCTALTSVDFSNLNTSITKLPDWTLYNCGITTFEIPSHITELGTGVFKKSKLASITIPASVTRIGNEAFRETKLTSFAIPAGVTIGTSLLRECSELAEVTFPAGITTIPDYTFSGCKALTGQITIPATVITIGENAFHNTIGVKEFFFPEGSQLTTIGSQAFYMEDYTNAQLERFIMPNTVSSIGSYALAGWRKLDWDNFHLSTQITSLPNYCFYRGGFTKFDLTQTSVTELKSNAFENNLFTEFKLPANVILNGSGHFASCENLERFYFEDGTSITSIPSYMFYYSTKLNYIYFPVATPPASIAYGTFSGITYSNVTLDVPAEAIEAYKSSSTWSGFNYLKALGPGTMDLTLEGAARKDWYIYDNNGHRYLYNDQYVASEDNNIAWYFNNTVEKKYSLLFNTGNRSNVNETDKLVMSLYKIDAEGSSLVETKTVQITNCSNSVYAFPNIFEQMLIDFDEPLAVGKYQVKLSRLGDNGKFVWDAQIVPTANLITTEVTALPVGAGKIDTGSSKLIQASDVAQPITLTTSLTATPWLTESWITFDGWTIDGQTVSTETSYTFTPTENVKVEANFTPERQTIPTPDGETFSTQHVIVSNPGVTQYYTYEGGNIGWIKKGNYLTYFVSNIKPAIYDFQFMTGIGNDATNDGQLQATVDVFDAEGNLVNSEVQTIAVQKPLSWRNTVAYSVRLTNPLMPGDYSVRITFYHPTCDNNADQTNFGAAGFELKAIVPEQIAVTETAKIKVDETTTLTATLSTTTGDAITKGYDGVAWTSSDAEVATVDQTGKVTAVAPGEATITAKATGRTDIELTAECAVTVPQHVTAITVAETAEVYTGEDVTVETTVAPETAEEKTLAWVSSDETIATVDQTGKITGVKAGTANITVTATDRNKVSKTIAVTVKQKVTTITLSASEKTMLKNETFQLSVSAYTPEDATQKEVTWSSSAPDVATVSDAGLVTALAGGTATITATAKDGKGATATCAITVDVPVTSVTLDKTSQNVYINDVVVLIATVAPDDATDATVTWSSSAPAVASVVDGTVTALTAGTAVIKATSNYDSSKEATFTLTVMDVQAQGEGANKLLFHNIANTSDLGANKVAWKSETDHSWVANSIVLTDAQPYANNADVAATSLTYNREFSDVAWQALYVPFAMNYSDWSGVADVAYINNVHQWDKDEDGVIDLTVLEFITEKTSVDANMPYVIRPKGIGEMSIELSDATLKASPAVDGSVDCSSTRLKYILTGTYKEKEMYGTGLYALTPTGEFCYANTADAKLSPFRIYLEIQSRTASPASMPHKIVVMVDGDIQDETTSIEMINALGGSDAIFNLAGQKVNESYKGVVIKNGKKIYKK